MQVARRAALICLLSALHSCGTAAGSNVVCARMQESRTGSVLMVRADACPRQMFCCAGQGRAAVCCSDCLQEIDFNPLMRAAECLGGRAKMPVFLTVMLPLLASAAMPAIFALTVVIALSVIGKTKAGPNVNA